MYALYDMYPIILFKKENYSVICFHAIYNALITSFLLGIKSQFMCYAYMFLVVLYVLGSVIYSIHIYMFQLLTFSHIKQ